MAIDPETGFDDDFVSVLSAKQDGMGYFYGHYKGHRIDISPPTHDDLPVWSYLVDGEPIAGADNKDLAERRARFFIERWLVET